MPACSIKHPTSTPQENRKRGLRGSLGSASASASTFNSLARGECSNQRPEKNPRPREAWVCRVTAGVTFLVTASLEDGRTRLGYCECHRKSALWHRRYNAQPECLTLTTQTVPAALPPPTVRPAYISAHGRLLLSSRKQPLIAVAESKPTAASVLWLHFVGYRGPLPPSAHHHWPRRGSPFHSN